MSDPSPKPAPCCEPTNNDSSCCGPAREETTCCAPPPTAASTCCPTHATEGTAETKVETPVSCCGGVVAVPAAPKSPASADVSLPDWIEGFVETPVGKVPRVGTTLRFADHVGTWKARWAINRGNYKIEPGLYAVGTPTAESPVLVSANYKMSFDRLRSELRLRDAWILVLDTRGINVWCAAGKGTFGSDEIIKRIVESRLIEVVSHRKLIVPQLGAPGVSAPKVKALTAFRVVYGPVRAADLPAFLDAGMKATPEMRQVQFPLRDRVALIPVELVMATKYALIVTAALFFLAGVGPGFFSSENLLIYGPRVALLFLGVCLAAVVLTPALLPWLPGRPFAVKGLWVGLAFAALVVAYGASQAGYFHNWLSIAACLLALPAVASFLGMNFTGSSTYTSLSGVRREMRIAVPLQIAGAALGLAFWIVGRFV